MWITARFTSALHLQSLGTRAQKNFIMGTCWNLASACSDHYIHVILCRHATDPQGSTAINCLVYTAASHRDQLRQSAPKAQQTSVCLAASLRGGSVGRPLACWAWGRRCDLDLGSCIVMNRTPHEWPLRTFAITHCIYKDMRLYFSPTNWAAALWPCSFTARTV